jgi:hypothetical protein
MPGFHKKRRHASGPNKNEEKVLRGKRAENQPKLGSRFSSIKQLRAQFSFVDSHQNELDRKSLLLGSADAAVFSFPCPGRCGHGSFSLDARLAQAVQDRIPSLDVDLPCGEALYAGAAQLCDCRLKGRLDIEYFPAPAQPAL